MRKVALGLVLVALAVGGWFIYQRSQRVSLTLVPGRSVWQHAKTIEKSGLSTEAEFLSLITNANLAQSSGLPIRPRQSRTDGVADTWFEGFIYPETYTFPPDAGAQAILERTTSQFKSIWQTLRTEYAAQLAELSARYNLSEADFIVLASLVEKEMALRSEAPVIAGVFYNRLAKGMRLETDPTLMYRPDRVGKAPSPTERKDRSNPYNTYAIKGLPPGPICSPGKDALLGVLNPASHDFLFFVAKRDGSRGHAFSTTLEEHRANIERYLRKAKPSP